MSRRFAIALPLDTRYRELLEVGLDVADELVEPPSFDRPLTMIAASRVALCFNQQLVMGDRDRTPSERAFALDELLAPQGWDEVQAPLEPVWFPDPPADAQGPGAPHQRPDDAPTRAREPVPGPVTGANGP